MTAWRLSPSAVAGLILLLLPGCVASAGYGTMEADTAPALLAGTAASWASLPPSAGEIVSVTERRAGDRTIQRIVLAGSTGVAGENALTIATVAPGGHADPELARPPTAEAVERDMAAAAPGIALSRTSALEQNAYGLFGTAFGRSGSTTCLYAWQYLPAGTAGAAPIDLRLRLCRPAEPSDLVAVMRGLSLHLAPVTTVTYGGASVGVDPLAAAAGMVRP